MHILISACYKLDSLHGSGNQGEASRKVTAKKGGSFENKSEHCCTFYCLHSLPLQHLLWAYGRQLAQPPAR